MPTTFLNSTRIWWAAALGLAAVLVAAAGFGGHRLGYARAMTVLVADSVQRLDLFASNAVLMINRWDRIAGTIELNRDVVELLRDQGPPDKVLTVNRYLHRLNAHLGSEAVFIANVRGLVVGSSNEVRSDDSRLGADVAYRPYYQDALSGFVGRHFALGAAPEEPGYFVAYPVRDRERVIGVAITKTSLAAIREAFALLGKPALIADRNDVVILASNPDWLYRTLKPLSVDQRVDLELTGMYGERRIEQMPFDLALPGAAEPAGGNALVETTAREAGEPMIAQMRALDGMDWRLLVFSPTGQLRWQADVAAALSALLAGFLLLLAAYLWQWRRIARQRQEARAALERTNAALETMVARRTAALTEANDGLRREMAERVQAEATLRDAQDDLVQAAKLAVFGELATGITHELAQPLGAIQTLAGNAGEFMRRGNVAGAQDNLVIIDGLVERMGGIIQPLKSFARKSSTLPEPVDLNMAVTSALFLLDQRLRAGDIQVANRVDAAAPPVWCNRNRLEQILINLIANAIDAMGGAAVRRLEIAADKRDDGLVAVEIGDSGSGLSPDVARQLFTPFYTTKPAGRGLGLGLTISRGIARDFGGDLSAENKREGGARFTLVLPQPPSKAAS